MFLLKVIFLAAVACGIIWLVRWFVAHYGPQSRRPLAGVKHQYLQAFSSEFRFLDLNFYDRTTDWLMRRNFIRVADLEDHSLTSRDRSRRTFMRFMAGDGGATIVRICHVAVNGSWPRFVQRLLKQPKDCHVVEFSTELENGIFVVTSNAEEIESNIKAAGIVQSVRPEDIPFEPLLDLHRETVFQVLGVRKSSTRIRSNMTSLLDSLHRLQRLKDEWIISGETAPAGRVSVEAGAVKSAALAKVGVALADEMDDELDIEQDVRALIDVLPPEPETKEEEPKPQAALEQDALRVFEEEEKATATADMEQRWNRFCKGLRKAIDTTQVQYVTLVAVPKDGSEIGIGRMHGVKPYLCFKRPDESGELENFKPFYLEGTHYDPPFSRIEAIVVGVDHNHVLYVLLEFLEEKEGERKFTLSFDPDWDQPTVLYLGTDLEAGKKQPFDARKLL